jgi:hypothetical protein
LPKCLFKFQYYDYEIRKEVDFYCVEESLASGFCIFHDKDYLQYGSNNEEYKRKVLDRLKHKVNHAISNNEPLFCIGFQLPEFSLSDLSNSSEFTKPVYFTGSQFFGNADFKGANFQEGVFFEEANFQKVLFTGVNFQGKVHFYKANFQKEALFNGSTFNGDAHFSNTEFYGKTYFSGEFNGETKFNYVLFEAKEKVIFDIENLSNVSFMNTDLIGVRFSEKASWGGKKAKEDRFKIRDERLLEEKINKEKDGHATKDFMFGSITQ